MPQYMLSVFQDEEGTLPSTEEIEEMVAGVAATQEEMKAAGVWVFFGALAPATSATVVRAVGGEVSMTDGPYAEAKEHIGGVTIIDVDDLDEALEWARKGSEACLGITVEVRPFMDGAPG